MNKLLFICLFFPNLSFSKNEDISPILTSGPVDAGSIFQVMASLLFIILIIVGLSWLYRKYGISYTSGTNTIKVISSLSLGGKEKVVLVQVGCEQILIGVSPGYVRKLHDVKEPVIDENTPVSNSFLSNFNKEIKKVMNK